MEELNESRQQNATSEPRLKHNGGRPKLKVKREKEMKIRLSATEEFLVKSKAGRAKMNVSTWFRKAAINARIVPRLTAEDMRSMHMLVGMANNLNQIAKLAHKDGILSIARTCHGLLTEIDQALKYFNRDDRENS